MCGCQLDQRSRRLERNERGVGSICWSSCHFVGQAMSLLNFRPEDQDNVFATVKKNLWNRSRIVGVCCVGTRKHYCHWRSHPQDPWSQMVSLSFAIWRAFDVLVGDGKIRIGTAAKLLQVEEKLLETSLTIRELRIKGQVSCLFAIILLPLCLFSSFLFLVAFWFENNHI